MNKTATDSGQPLVYPEARMLKRGDLLYLRRTGGAIRITHFNEITRALSFELRGKTFHITPKDYHSWSVVQGKK